MHRNYGLGRLVLSCVVPCLSRGALAYGPMFRGDLSGDGPSTALQVITGIITRIRVVLWADLSTSVGMCLVGGLYGFGGYGICDVLFVEGRRR